MQQEYGCFNMVIMFLQMSKLLFRSSVFCFLALINFGCSLALCATTVIRRNAFVRLSEGKKQLEKNPVTFIKTKAISKYVINSDAAIKHSRMSNRAGWWMLDVWRLPNCICCLAFCLMQVCGMDSHPALSIGMPGSHLAESW